MAGPRVSLRTFKRTIVAAVALAVLAVALPVAYGWWEERRSQCADGVVKKGPSGECVGVTDGSYPFDQELFGDVMGRIRDENKAVLDSGKGYVSIAYMTSLTLEETDSNSEESVRHELQGAHLAQLRANRWDRKGSPLVRLLIANVGSGSEYWEHTVGELVRRKSRERLVAVTGLGPSTEANRQAVKRLSKEGLATVAGTMTATDIHSIKGFVRVAPTNADEAWAAAVHLRGEEKDHRALVVKDMAADNLYAHTLSRDFTDELTAGGRKPEMVVETKAFDSSVSEGWQNQLSNIAQQMCHYEHKVIYFAGRGQHLTHFLDSLANRSGCRGREFTVMTGDDTTNLTGPQLKEAARSGVQVRYTGLAHPEMWQEGSRGVSPKTIWYFREADDREGEGAPAEPEGGAEEEPKRLVELFPGDSHDDGQAMMSHDAVLTAVTGARMAGENGGKVNGETVGGMFQTMDGDQEVPGASGFLVFEEDGNPRGKAIPILDLKQGPDGESVALEFVKVVCVPLREGNSRKPPGECVTPEEDPDGR